MPVKILDLSIEDDYESDCESVDLQYDYTLLLKNNNKYQEYISFKKKMMVKSFTDFTLLKKKSPSLKTKLKNKLRKIKSF